MVSRRVKTRYVKPTKYTPEQLDAAAKSDLETDLRCALRDGHQEYATEVRAQLARIESGESAHDVVTRKRKEYTDADWAPFAAYGLTELPPFVTYTVGDPLPTPGESPRWSGKGALALPPAIGSRVYVALNGYGPGEVVAYFTESGFLGVEVKVDKLPDWAREQRKRHGMSLDVPVMVFGAEVREEES